MRPESEDLLSTLIDGEPVDPDRLAEVLSEGDAAETLVAFVRIRHRVEHDSSTPGREFYGRVASVLNPDRSRLAARARVLLLRFAVAILVAAAALGGHWLGRHSRPGPGEVTLTGAYCTDRLGALHPVGSVAAVEGRQLECVLRGEWVAVPR